MEQDKLQLDFRVFADEFAKRQAFAEPLEKKLQRLGFTTVWDLRIGVLTAEKQMMRATNHGLAEELKELPELPKEIRLRYLSFAYANMVIARDKRPICADGHGFRSGHEDKFFEEIVVGVDCDPRQKIVMISIVGNAQRKELKDVLMSFGRYGRRVEELAYATGGITELIQALRTTPQNPDFTHNAIERAYLRVGRLF